MTKDQVRFVMDRIQKRQETTIEDVKFPVTVIVRLNFGHTLRPVTLNCLNFVGDGKLNADYEHDMLIITKNDDAKNSEYIPFDSICSIRVKIYELEDKKFF